MDFKILGPPEVIDGSGTKRAIGGPKQRALLAALLTSPGEAIGIDTLADAVWPRNQPDRPRRALQVSITRLRAVLSQRRIQSKSDGYRLALAEGDTVDAFLLERAADGDGDPCAALGLWRDTPFSDLADWHPAQVRIARLTEVRAAVAVRCLDRQIDDGRFDAAVGLAKELLVEHPYDERLWIALVRALRFDGRSAEAAGACQQMRQTLAQTLGLDPSPEFVEIEARVLGHEPITADRRSRRGLGGTGNGPPGLLGRFVERPFAGRDNELDLLDKYWAEAGTGRTQLVLVTGEGGIGKTHLAAMLASGVADDGGSVMFGSGSPEQPALGPLAEALDRVVPDLDRLPLTPRRRALLGRAVPDLAPPEPISDDPEHDRSEFAEALAQALAGLSVQAPMLLIIDDLHWAGRSTFRALGDVIRTRPDLALLVVATMRDVPPDTSPELQELTADLLRLPPCHHLPLTGLDAAAVLELLGPSAEPAEATALTERTAGSPLFVTQLAAGGRNVNDRHSGLTLAITDRIRRLGPAVSDILRTAAVVGERFAVDVLLRRMADEGFDAKIVVAALSKAEAAGLLQPAGGRGQEMRFHHALVRDVLYDSWSTMERMSEHCAVAQAWSSIAENQTGHLSGEIAWHFHHAGPFAEVDDCVRHARAAAHAAAEAGAAAEAARYFSLPLALHALEERQRCGLMVEKAEMEGAAGQDGQSVTTSLEAAEIAGRHGWDDLIVRAALSHAPTSGRWVSLSDGAQGGELVAIALDRASGQSVQQARLALREACFNCLRYSVDHRRRLCDPAIARLRREGSPGDLLLGMMDAYWALQNSLRPPFDLYEELVELGHQIGTPRSRWLAFMAEHADAWYRQDLDRFASAVYSDPSIGTDFAAVTDNRRVINSSVICLLGPPSIRNSVLDPALEWDWERTSFSRPDLEPPSGGEAATLTGLGAITTNNRHLAGQVYAQLLPIRDGMAGTPWNPLPVTHFVLGRLCEFLGHLRMARDHFEQSLVLHRRYGSPPLVRLSEQALAESDRPWGLGVH